MECAGFRVRNQANRPHRLWTTPWNRHPFFRTGPHAFSCFCKVLLSIIYKAVLILICVSLAPVVDFPWYLAPRLGCMLDVSRLGTSVYERIVNGLQEAASPRPRSVHSFSLKSVSDTPVGPVIWHYSSFDTCSGFAVFRLGEPSCVFGPPGWWF
jgi:hypothetical protein